MLFRLYFVNQVFAQNVNGLTHLIKSKFRITINFDGIPRQLPEQEADDLEVIVIE